MRRMLQRRTGLQQIKRFSSSPPPPVTISCNNSIGFWVEFSAIRIIQSMEADPGKRRQQKKFEPKKKEQSEIEDLKSYQLQRELWKPKYLSFQLYLTKSIYYIIIIVFFIGIAFGPYQFPFILLLPSLYRKSLQFVWLSEDCYLIIFHDTILLQMQKPICILMEIHQASWKELVLQLVGLRVTSYHYVCVILVHVDPFLLPFRFIMFSCLDF